MAHGDYSNGDSFSTLHPDIIQTQILTRLDGPTLTSTASTSSYIHTLCTEQKLWQELSTAAWPSVNDPRVVKAISSFPSGYRSFFADSYPFSEHTWHSEKDDPPTTGLISAVDLYYRGELIYSKVQEMETESGKGGWFLSTPFRVDLIDPKESVETRIRYPGGDYEAWVRDMEESMKLNWILIDPVKKRAANISSRDAVSAKRNWLTGDLEIRFSTVVTGKRAAEVAMVLSCGSAETWKEVDEEVGGEVHVREVRLGIEDIEGKCLKGRESVVILQGLLEGKRSRKDGCGEQGRGKGKYEEYVEMKTEWRKKKERREKFQDTICMIFGFSLFVLLWIPSSTPSSLWNTRDTKTRFFFFSSIQPSSESNTNKFRCRAVREKAEKKNTSPSPEEVTKKYGLEVGLWKILSSKDEESDGEEKKKKSKTDEAKELLAKYGGAYLATSITLSLVSFSLCYALVTSGVDVQALLLKVGISTNETGEKVGAFALAYAAHKAASPIRFPPTVALTPIVANWIGKKVDKEKDDE
ncbi:unnamed protein product [Brassica oleracea]